MAAMQQIINRFFKHDAAGGILLILASVLALVLANAPTAGFYTGVQNSGLLAVNDGLMTLFFLLIGLEIKREVLGGELSTRDKALVPVFAAIGGMVAPALCFFAVGYVDDDILRGWAIPCATDIAFALGILALLGSRIPQQIKILLMAIAILDDLAAILIIAFFYSAAIDVAYLVSAMTMIIIMITLNRLKITSLPLYCIFGLFVWFAFLKAGIHPTLAGVVTAFAIPPGSVGRFERKLHHWVTFAILPIFAFMNAGVSFAGVNPQAFYQPLVSGIFVGLLFGKPFGILGGMLIGHFTGWARVAGRWRDYIGMACLCGIGFTMALFIGGLAFDNPDHMAQVKLGVLSASLLSAVIGWVVCRLTFIHKTA
jgi:NhaA family Na+:H+ antiporter